MKKGAIITAGVGVGMFLTYKIYQAYFGKKKCPPAADKIKEGKINEEVIMPIQRNDWHGGQFFTKDKILARILIGEEVEEQDGEDKEFVIDGELKNCYDLVSKIETQLQDALKVKPTAPEEIAQLNELYKIAKKMFFDRLYMLGIVELD